MASPPSPGGPGPDPEVATRVTRLLQDWSSGTEEALDDLLPLLYGELHRLAHFALRGEAQGHTLQTTALVNEAYMRLVGFDHDWEGRRHFLRVAARAMRQVLVDHARKRQSQKRGSDPVLLDISPLEAALAAPDTGGVDLLELDEALQRLFALDERKGRAVELHYFAGLSYDETAEALEISPATVHRDLRLARAWLQKELSDDEG